MKQLIIILLASILSIGTIAAQQSGREAVARQAQYFVGLFQLQEQQAETFKSAFYAYTKQMRTVQTRYQHERPAEGTVLSDEEVEQRILDNFAMSRDILEVREQYYHEFRKVLTPSQIQAIFENEKTRRTQIQK